MNNHHFVSEYLINKTKTALKNRFHTKIQEIMTANAKYKYPRSFSVFNKEYKNKNCTKNDII